MRKLNPVLLDVLYRVGAYPFDELEIDESHAKPASVWVLPKGPLPVFLAILGNGTSTAAVIAELHRLAHSFSFHHGKVPDSSWGYLIVAHCENTHSRIVSREMREFEPEEIAVGMNSYAFIPWFDPPDEAKPAYDGDTFSTALLPASELEQDDQGLYTSRDWEDLADAPESLEKSFAASLGLDIGNVPTDEDEEDEDPFDYDEDEDEDEDDEAEDTDDEDEDEGE